MSSFKVFADREIKNFQELLPGLTKAKYMKLVRVMWKEFKQSRACTTAAYNEFLDETIDRIQIQIPDFDNGKCIKIANKIWNDRFCDNVQSECHLPIERTTPVQNRPQNKRKSRVLRVMKTPNPPNSLDVLSKISDRDIEKWSDKEAGAALAYIQNIEDKLMSRFGMGREETATQKLEKITDNMQNILERITDNMNDLLEKIDNSLDKVSQNNNPLCETRRPSNSDDGEWVDEIPFESEEDRLNSELRDAVYEKDRLNSELRDAVYENDVERVRDLVEAGALAENLSIEYLVEYTVYANASPSEITSITSIIGLLISTGARITKRVMSIICGSRQDFYYDLVCYLVENDLWSETDDIYGDFLINDNPKTIDMFIAYEKLDIPRAMSYAIKNNDKELVFQLVSAQNKPH